jgi:hypothetical protein
VNLSRCSVAAAALLVATSSLASAHSWNPSWRADHGLPPLPWDCPAGPDATCLPPAADPAHPPSNLRDWRDGGAWHPPAVDGPPPVIQPPSIDPPHGDVTNKPPRIDPPLVGNDPPKVPPGECRAPTEEEMRTLCEAGNFTPANVPTECIGWISRKTTGVIPVQQGCDGPPPPPEDTCNAPGDWFANPFSAASAAHRLIGPGAQYAGDDHPSTRSLRSAPFGNINSGNGWGFNVYRASTGDTMRTIDGASVRVPPGAAGGRTSDSAVVIVDGTTAHEFYSWDGSSYATIHRQYDITGPGSGGRLGVTASGLPGLFGLLRGAEMNAPGCRIEHALNFVLPRRPDHVANMLSTQVVSPACCTDTGAGSGGTNQGAVPYGAHLALPPGTDLSGLSEPGRRMADALQRYGGYVLDGSEIPTMRGDQYIDAGVKNQMISDMRKLWPHMRMVVSD